MLVDLWTLAVQVNTVGFYQLSKICITPAVLIFDAMVSKKLPTRRETAAVTVLCVGVALATISDGDMSTNLVGMAVALAAISFTAVYQVRPCDAPGIAQNTSHKGFELTYSLVASAVGCNL